MIHLIYFGVGLLALVVAAIIPFIVGYGICFTDGLISGIKLPRFSYSGYWGTGFAFMAVISLIYFVGALFYIGCGK